MRVPSCVTVIEERAVYVHTDYSYRYEHVYCDIYLEFDSSASVPDTWDADWCYYYNNGYGSSYWHKTVHYGEGS